MNDIDILSLGKEAVQVEMEGLNEILSQMDETFVRAVRAIAELNGKVILTGVGKSGIIAKKIASTMASIGTPAAYMNPLDALHGDLGTIMPQDAAIIISNSGNTKEICDLIPSLKTLDIPVIAITGNLESPLAKGADIVLKARVKREACGLNLAPTASTTAQLAVGDALAVVLSHIKGFDRDRFKVYHPAGELGKQLMTGISQVMIAGERIPLVCPDASLDQVVVEMTDKSLGFTLVGDMSKVDGIITDGDLRRTLLMHSDEIQGMCAGDIMSPDPKTISIDMLALDALEMMEGYQITSLIVMDDKKPVIQGVVHLHDLLGRGKLGLRG